MKSEPHITVRGQKVFFHTFWQGKGRESYVLIHGIGVSMRYFLPFAKELSKTATVYVLDLPGFGNSPQPRRTFTIEDYAEIVEAFIKRRHLEQPIVVGHSMGCQIVVELLRQHPEMAQLGIIIGPVINVRERTIHQQLGRLLQDAVREPWWTGLLVLSDYIRCGLRWYLKVLPYMIAYPIEEKIKEVTTPLLIIRGRRDLIAPRLWVEQLQRVAPHAIVRNIKGAHNVMHDLPKTVAAYCEEMARHAQAS